MKKNPVRHDSARNGFPFVPELTRGLGKVELQQRMLQALRGGELCNRALAFYLADMEQRQVHVEFGLESTFAFATKHLGLSKGRARDLLQTGRKLGSLCKLDAALAAGKLSWSKVRRLARVATPDSEQAWIAHASRLTHEEVDAVVAISSEGDWPSRVTKTASAPRRKRVSLTVQQTEAWEIARAVLAQKTGSAVVSDGDVVDALLRRFLELPLATTGESQEPTRRGPHSVVAAPTGSDARRTATRRAQLRAPSAEPAAGRSESPAPPACCALRRQRKPRQDVDPRCGKRLRLAVSRSVKHRRPGHSDSRRDRDR